MPKRKNATRTDGRIQIKIFLGRDENGKKKYRYVYGHTQKEAEQKAEEIKLSLRKGLNIIDANSPFSLIANRWLKIKLQYVQGMDYKSSVEQINTYIGDIPISKINIVDIQDMINSLAICNPNTGKPASKRTLVIRKCTTKQIFDMAIENRIIDFNPAIYIKIPKDAPRSLRRALTKEEQSWILNTEHRAQTAAMIMMYAGLRRGELIPLMWNDINFSESSINVNKSVYKVGNKFVVKQGAKTRAGSRTIYPPKILMNYLSQLPKSSLYVCANANGQMHTTSSWSSMWNSYLHDLNLKYGKFSFTVSSKYDPKGVPFVIPHITPHWLRHTCATLLYFAGYDIKAAMEYLGHSDMKTTLEIYTHLDAQYKKSSSSKFDNYLANIGNNN